MAFFQWRFKYEPKAKKKELIEVFADKAHILLRHVQKMSLERNLPPEDRKALSK